MPPWERGLPALDEGRMTPWERGLPALDEGRMPSLHCSLRVSVAAPAAKTPSAFLAGLFLGEAGSAFGYCGVLFEFFEKALRGGVVL